VSGIETSLSYTWLIARNYPLRHKTPTFEETAHMDYTTLSLESGMSEVGNWAMGYTTDELFGN
jgi:hypothetical protein